MRRLLFGSVLILLLPALLPAQEFPKAEVFGGYSYFRANPEGYNLNGWNASISGNILPWFGIVGDFSGHYGAPSQFGFRIPGVNISSHTFMAGPKLSYRDGGRLTPFAHFLIGAARAGTSAFGFSLSDTSIAAAVGGGLDIKVSNSLAVRVIQADYLMTRFNASPDLFFSQRQNNARLSFGIVLRLGE